MTRIKTPGGPSATNENLPVYGRPEFAGALDLSHAVLPEEPTAPESVYQLIRNELMMDAQAGLNLATFCNEAYTDPWGERVVHDSIKKNFIDHTEYPGTNLSESRSIMMVARELGVEIPQGEMPGERFYGSATIGSSEAVMLGLIAHKFMWNMRQRVLLDNPDLLPMAADPRDRPVVLMSSQVHGCWDKFCRYYDAYGLYVEVDGPPYAIHDPTVFRNILETAIDDPTSPYAQRIRAEMGYTSAQPGRTIGDLVMCVGAVVGSTFTGNYDDVRAIDDSIDQYCRARSRQVTASQRAKFKKAYCAYYKQKFPVQEKPTRIPDIFDIPIHVDAASAGFVLMFSSSGSGLPFNFRDCRKRVQSINVSNHKFGMTFSGMGSVIFRDDKVVDQSLVYDIAYLGGHFNDYTVNFSRGSAMIVMQYYNFLRFGRRGYQSIMDNCLKNTAWFIAAVEKDPLLGKHLECVSNIPIKGRRKIFLPIIAFTWKTSRARKWTLADLSSRLRDNGWVVPAYSIPKRGPEDTDGIPVLRIVVQQVVSREKLTMLLNNMITAVKDLDAGGLAAARPESRRGHRC